MPDMASLSPTIAERSRKNHAAILRSLAAAGQARVAALIGVDDSTITRIKDGQLERLAAVLAASGLKVVPEEPCILAGSRPGDVLLDPFFGSGTTGQVAQALGRQWVGCELNPAYEPLQRERTAQTGLQLESAA